MEVSGAFPIIPRFLLEFGKKLEYNSFVYS